jgi:hypothetical protein
MSTFLVLAAEERSVLPFLVSIDFLSGLLTLGFLLVSYRPFL